jgi:aminopeptidase N
MRVWLWVLATVGMVGQLAAQRLPANVRPEHYALAITPDIANATFSGTETIDVTLASSSKTVALNALELEIQSVTANGQAGAVTFDPTKEQATFTFAHAIPAGHATLAVTFTGILNDKLRGFYLSKTRERSYAVTQFEATDARRAFPCFDEPALKATFDVSLTVDAGDTVISNTNMISDNPAGVGKHTQVFATTPKMSTYLVAYLVGDFACTKGKSDGVPIRVCSTPDKVDLTRFAVKAAEHFLHYYDDYFGIKYPMPKLDLIAIPDFEAGAMENFGAITYRETELLVEDKDSSINSRKSVAVTVAHEMAHQWFGDMVTMQWWDNLWLNEGFATWMENKAADEWHPEWHFPQDVASDMNDTLNYDAARTTRTIRAKAETPADIQEMFDGIAYGKAGAVIGMIENWIGPDVFRQGVHNYLAAHLYANATAEDFWNAQTANSKQPVDKVMSSFVDKAGVPLLSISAETGKGVATTERRFYLDSSVANKDKGDWTIPACVKTADGQQCLLVGPGTKELGAKELNAAQGGKLPFFYANAGEKGYYRVAYTPEQVKAIIAAAETGLTAPERIGFLGDRWALTRAGEGSVGDYLDLAFALKTDTNAQVLDTALNTIEQIRNKIAADDDRLKLDAVIRAQLGPVYAALGKDKKDDSYDQQEIRTELFQALGEAEDPAVLQHARELTDALFEQHKTPEPEVIDASVAIAAAEGDENFYEAMMSVVEGSSKDPGLQTEVLEMLARFRAPALVKRTLEYAVSGNVRNQDSWVLIAIELSQAKTREIAWPWVQAHWDQVKAQLTTASGADLISAVGSFCTVEQRDEVKNFFTTHKVDAADRTLAKSLDGIDACVRLRAAQEPRLREWLAAH